MPNVDVHQQISSFRFKSVAGNVLLLLLAIALAFNNLQFVLRGDWSAALYVVHMVLVAILALIRHPAKQSAPLFSQAMLVALLGTVVPMTLNASHQSHAVLYTAGLTLQLVGECLAIYATATLGRSFCIVAANREVVISGPYRIVRHPIYMGYFIALIGFVLAHMSIYNVQVFSVILMMQVIRILTEEQILSADPAYRGYQISVKARLIPNLW
jgi:protein-S-isoprenylcysteine O-methyltransferase Ste14